MPELRSPTKFVVLRLIEQKGRVSSADLVKLAGMKLATASKQLKRYHVEGLLRREKRMGRSFIYSLTDAGAHRLSYFKKIA